MKPLSLLVLAALVLMTNGAFARGGGGDDRRGSVMKDEAIAQSLERFDQLAEHIKKTYPNNQEYQDIVTEARANFDRQAGSFLPAKPYRRVEFKLMQDIVGLTITNIKQNIEIAEKAEANGMTAQDVQAATVENARRVTQRMVTLLTDAGMAPKLPEPNADAASNGALGLSAGVSGINPENTLRPQRGVGGIGAAVGNQLHAGSHAGGLGVNALPADAHGTPDATVRSIPNRGKWNGGWFEGDEQGREEWERRLGENSLIVVLGVKSTKCAMDPAACAPLTPQPVPVPPGEPGQQPAPVPPGNTNPAGGNSGGYTNVGAIDELNRTVASNGTTNAIASGALLALQRGDYARAASAAKLALGQDPGNRTALEVLYSAKGRVAATGAADSGAAHLGRSAGGAEALGSAGGVPAGIAGGPSAGALRAASEQASEAAKSAMKLGDAEGAVAILTKALAQDPNNPALLNFRAMAYGRTGRWEEALRDASFGLRLLPGNTALLGVKSMAENRTRKWRDALASSDAMIAADPRSAWGYAARAHAYGGLGNREAMLADINRAAALDPNFRRAAEAAAELQLPSDSDVLFLFPGEAPKGSKTAAPASSGKGRTFSLIVGAGVGGGLLFALGLLSLVLAPVKDSVVSVFTRSKRTGAGPATAPVATAQPASAAGNVSGLIRGQYEIARQIGAGGMGMVYEGTDRSLGRRVAIKKMREELRQNPRERDRFIIEAKTVASLHHPNIVDIYAIAEEGDDVYLVFEFVDGKTVHDLVQAKGRLDPSDTVRVTRAMGDALTYAHSHGVIHRDMKPSNVMLTSSGQVKVMDFGIARMAKDAMTRYSMTNTVVGTPPYMAPEQEQGVVRKESDVYSLAICAYEMLTGKLPFIGMGAGMLMNKINMSYVPPSRAIAGLPESLDEVFLKAFQADPDRRHRTPQEFVAALEASLGGARAKA